MRRRIARVVSFVKGVAGDRAVPAWAKGLLAVAALPLPGPVDELLGLLVVAFLLARHRDLVRRHWRASAAAPGHRSRGGWPSGSVLGGAPDLATSPMITARAATGPDGSGAVPRGDGLSGRPGPAPGPEPASGGRVSRPRPGA